MRTLAQFAVLATLVVTITTPPTPAQTAQPVPEQGKLAPTPPAPADKTPFPSQVMKTVVFIKADCEPSADDLAKLTPGALATLTPEEIEKIRHPSFVGTGFLVAFPDSRLGNDGTFIYIVTNRHVVQPGIEDGKPRKVLNYSVYLNRRNSPGSEQTHLQIVSLGPDAPWILPEDDPAVDLAVMSVNLPQTDWDYKTVPLDFFVSQELLDQKKVVEGDPIFFVGLFIQLSDFSSAGKVEPILRTGTIAELPANLEPTTLKRMGHIYLIEAHSFGGNSGSPVLVDVNKFTGPGYDYKFLGVVAGNIIENNDFTLQVTTDYRGAVRANSGISVVVPADEVKKMLSTERMQRLRDDAVAQFLKARGKL